MTKLDEPQNPETPATTTTDSAPKTAEPVVNATEVADLKASSAKLQGDLQSAQDEIKTLKEQLSAKEQKMAEDQSAQQNEALQSVTTERDQLKSEVSNLRLEKELTGKVLDPDAAIKLMGEGFRTQDGKVDVDKFLETYPYLKPTPAATAPNGGGGVTTTTGKDAELQTLRTQLDTATKNGNRVLAVSLQSKITALETQ